MAQEFTREYLDEKFDDFSKKIDEKFDDFSKIVADGFDGVQEQFKEVHARIDKLYNLVDGFIALHQKLDQELTALRAKYERLEDRIAKLEAARA